MGNPVRTTVYHWLRHSIEHVSGLEHVPARGPYLLAANHIDFLDGYYLLASLYNRRPDTIHFLSESNNYWWTGFVHPVHWDNREATIQEIIRLLSRGAVVCNFPEGRRNQTASLLRGKTGTIRMALAARVPIIPVGLRGPGGKTFAESVRLSRQSVGRSITFGRPFDLSAYQDQGLTEELLHHLNGELMERIAAVSGKQVSA